MTLRLIFAPLARAEIVEALDWYEVRAQGMGRRLFGEIDALALRIVANPPQFPVVYKTVRRARLRQFPYSLFFRIEDEIVHVLACFHASREPRRWQRRS